MAQEPAWKRETKAKFSQILAPDKVLLAVTGGLAFGRKSQNVYIGLTESRLILLDLEGWLGKALGFVGIRPPRRGYVIHRSLISAAEIEKSSTGTALIFYLSSPSKKLVFEQVALGAEELVRAFDTSQDQGLAPSAQDLIESARALQTFGLKGAAQNALSDARKIDPSLGYSADATLATDRWEEEQKAYQTAGVFLGIVIGLGALMTLATAPAEAWSLEFCGEYIIGVLAAFVLLRPLFQDPPAGRKEVFGRIATTMLMVAILLVISRDFELLAGVAGVYGAIILLLTGKPGRTRRIIAIAIFVVSLIAAMAAMSVGFGAQN